MLPSLKKEVQLELIASCLRMHSLHQQAGLQHVV